MSTILTMVLRKPLRTSQLIKTAMNSTKVESAPPTINQLKLDFMKRIGAQPGYSPTPPSRSHLQKFVPKPEDLPPRSMQDSYLVGTIPLSTDQHLQDTYVTFLGHVRIGRLLEDMDMFAVLVAQKHIHVPNLPEGVPLPYTIVTAHIDQIDFSDYVPKPNEDIKLSGRMTWVGKSSMEVIVWLEQKVHNSWHNITRALFVLAARDPENKKATAVNQLVPIGQNENQMLLAGEQRRTKRIEAAKLHVSKVIPTIEEQKIIHDLYVQTTDNSIGLKPLGVFFEKLIPMENCKLTNVIFTHPEHRNLHNTIFGGFIMRQAIEIAWILGYRFSKHRPILKSISDIRFLQAIHVSSLMQMTGYVTYTSLQYYQVTVFVEVYEPASTKSVCTNTFNFTFMSPEMVPQVYPESYHEAMLYVDGRRHFNQVLESEKDANVFEAIENISSKL